MTVSPALRRLASPLYGWCNFTLVLPMLRLLPVLLILLLLPACRGKADKSDPAKDLMPKGATMVITAQGDSPDKWERSFNVRAAYPKLGISDDAFARLRGHGWKRCESEQDKWSESADRSRGIPAKVYRRAQYWRHGPEVLMIVFLYRVPADVDPDAALLTQRVTLSFHGAPSPEDTERWNRYLGPFCDG